MGSAKGGGLIEMIREMLLRKRIKYYEKRIASKKEETNGSLPKFMRETLNEGIAKLEKKKTGLERKLEHRLARKRAAKTVKADRREEKRLTLFEKWHLNKGFELEQKYNQMIPVTALDYALEYRKATGAFASIFIMAIVAVSVTWALGTKKPEYQKAPKVNVKVAYPEDTLKSRQHR